MCVALVPPSIADEPTDLVVTRLSPVVIACTATGVPEPEIHWSKGSTKLLNEGEGYSILPTGQFFIYEKNVLNFSKYFLHLCHFKFLLGISFLNFGNWWEAC